MSKILELFGLSTQLHEIDWGEVIQQQHCPFLNRKCVKVRKSDPDVSIGTCTVSYSAQDPKPLIICPYRLLGRHQVFMDCIHLLMLHEPGNELHVVSEISIPGGTVDYFLVSTKNGRVKDFVGIEFQTVDTTGTVWPERQRFLASQGLEIGMVPVAKSYGVNWKMSAKTILMQLHHKVETFEGLGKHLVLVIQNHFMHYMQSQFRFEHLNSSLVGDALHLHIYELSEQDGYRLGLESRYSTDAQGLAAAMGLQADPKLELEDLIHLLEVKLSDNTLFIPLG